MRERLLRALLWEFSGRLVLTVIGIVTSVILARLLSPEDFGEMAVVTVAIVLAKTLIDVGLGSALIQRRKLHPAHANSVFVFNMFAGTLLGSILYLLAPVIASFYALPQLEPLLQAVSGVFVLYAFASVQTTLLRRELRFDLLSKVGVGSAAGSAVVALLMAFFGAGVWSLAVQAGSQALFTAAGMWIVSPWRPGSAVSFKALYRLWGFGFRMFITSVLENVFSRLDTLIIARLFPVAILGYYNRARNLDQMIVSYSSSALMSVLFPAFSREQHATERFGHMVMKGYAVLLFGVFFLLGGFYVTAGECVPLLLGSQWGPAADLFQILLLSSYAYPLSALLLNVLSSRGQSARLLQLELYRKGIFSINLIVGFVGGIEGYLYGLALVSFINVVLAMWYASKELGNQFRAFFQPFVAQVAVCTAAAGTVVSAFPLIGATNVWEVMIGKASFFAILYFVIGYVVGTMASKTAFAQIERIPLLLKRK